MKTKYLPTSLKVIRVTVKRETKKNQCAMLMLTLYQFNVWLFYGFCLIYLVVDALEVEDGLTNYCGQLARSQKELSEN